jgi:acylphosphatase
MTRGERPIKVGASGQIYPDGAQPGARGAQSDVEENVRLCAWVSGRVQGVGFRWWTRARALELGLAGWARNAADGRVEVVAEGNREACERLVEGLRGGDSPGQVAAVVERYTTAKNDISGFRER